MKIEIFINDGAGNFTDSGQLLGQSGTTKVAFGDFDNDGDLDFYEASFAAPKANKVWLNQNFIANLTVENDSPTALGMGTILTASVGDGPCELSLGFWGRCFGQRRCCEPRLPCYWGVYGRYYSS